MTLEDSMNRSQAANVANFELCKMLVSANIPFYKLENMKPFLQANWNHGSTGASNV